MVAAIVSTQITQGKKMHCRNLWTWPVNLELLVLGFRLEKLCFEWFWSCFWYNLFGTRDDLFPSISLISLLNGEGFGGPEITNTLICWPEASVFSCFQVVSNTRNGSPCNWNWLVQVGHQPSIAVRSYRMVWAKFQYTILSKTDFAFRKPTDA